MSGGSSQSTDVVELQYLLDQYLSLSKFEEDLIRNFDISDSDNQAEQYNILKTMSVLNSRLYNFAVSNPKLTRASFDVIYPLLSYSDKFDDAYESNSSSQLNKCQRELLTDVNSVVDLLSDIIEALQNADINASSSDDGNSRNKSTPQDLIDEQKKLNSKTDPQKGQDKESGDEGDNSGSSESELSEIIQKQEEIRNKFNELNGGNSSKLDKEIKELKKTLLKGDDGEKLKQLQDRIVRLLKDFKGEAKEKDKKRKSKSSDKVFESSNTDKFNEDIIKNRQEELQRQSLDFKEFYKNKINRTQ